MHTGRGRAASAPAVVPWSCYRRARAASRGPLVRLVRVKVGLGLVDRGGGLVDLEERLDLGLGLTLPLTLPLTGWTSVLA